MSDRLITAPFLAVTFTNFCLFLIVTTWGLLPLFIVDLGGNAFDVGIVMGSLGATSLGCLPFLAPLIDRFGRKKFIVWGILAVGVSNAGFLAFDRYSVSMILLRLVQGVAFAACFNGCSAAVVDFIPEKRRAEGIGLFGVSASIATAIGPYLGEACIIQWGYGPFFFLLGAFGLLGFLVSMTIKESMPSPRRNRTGGFFATASRGGYLPMMAMAAAFGAGFSAAVNFFPLFVKSLGLRVGAFFLSYGVVLLLIRVLLGRLADSVDRDRLILCCLLGFSLTLTTAAFTEHFYQTLLVGAMFGAAQGFAYPAMMARMVDRSEPSNRAVVVALYTGSFGVGIHTSSLVWGFLAELGGLPSMFLSAAALMAIVAFIGLYPLFLSHRAKVAAHRPLSTTTSRWRPPD